MNVLAIDLGASGGRVCVGRFDGERLAVEEVRRFGNDPVRLGARLHWDVLRLFHEVKQGLSAALPAKPASLGIDSWGLDFGLLGANGELLGNPYHYRDEQTRGMMEEVWALVPREEIFVRTGIQFMPINTLYQLFALKRAGSALLAQAASLLLMPDLLRFFLTGECSSEYTNATTTQCLDLRTGDWDRSLLRRLDLPDRVLTPVVPPATDAGRLLPAVGRETGAGELAVVAVATHDTASAVAAVPAIGEFAYLSCGTWSLLGTEVTEPVVDRRALDWNFTNEGGIGGTFRLLKNIMGLWLVEQCRCAWEREGNRLSYPEMEAAMLTETPFAALIDPDAPRFLNPAHMPREIQAFCRETGQATPERAGQVLRCVHESLALKYRLVLERTERLTGRRFPGLHVVGGGGHNRQLCQFAANAIGRPVWAGPAEATAVGNMLAQYMAAGRIGSLTEGRAVVRASCPVQTFEPREGAAWDEAFQRFLTVAAG